ncbi:hypothetical protein NW760_010181 [Fusarium oxysporum]|nr:hypothetical protein NW769_009963 [Fusarium oxysporum]KAJ4223565.1 hypothetical protein NW760_010181 [Fusarium oxysporum]
MGATGNYAHMVDVMASNAAKVIKTARQKLESQRPGSGEKLTLEPIPAVEEAWAQKVLATALWFGCVSGCTPSYGTAEGREVKSAAEAEIAARAGIGVEDFQTILQWGRLGW